MAANVSVLSDHSESDPNDNVCQCIIVVVVVWTPPSTRVEYIVIAMFIVIVLVFERP